MRESTRAAASTRQAAMAASPSEAEDFRRVFDLFHRQVLSIALAEPKRRKPRTPRLRFSWWPGVGA